MRDADVLHHTSDVARSARHPVCSLALTLHPSPDLSIYSNKVTLISALLFPLLLVLPMCAPLSDSLRYSPNPLASYVPPLQIVFQCRAVTYGALIWLATFVLIFVYDEARKYLIRRGGKTGVAHQLAYY